MADKEVAGTRERYMQYLKELIQNRGIVTQNSNSNLLLAKKYLDEFSIQSKVIENNGHLSLITKKGPFLLNSHVDVVPGEEHQFQPLIEGNRIYGRGAADALGCAVGMIIATQELYSQGIPVTLMLVSDEEIGGLYGTGYLLEDHYAEQELKDIRYSLVGEPTQDFGFSIKEKGILRLHLEVHGAKGHPERSGIDNAIIKAAKIINEVDQLNNDNLLINPNLITSGTAPNIIPDSASIEFDIRYDTSISKEDIMDKFERICKDNPIKILKHRNASECDMDNPYFKILDKVCDRPPRTETNGASDYSYLYSKNVSGVTYGIRGSGWHMDKEYAEIDSLFQYLNNLINFIKEAKRWDQT